MTDVRRLPTPISENWDWQMRGACRDRDTALFFHPTRERGPSRRARVRQAKQICGTCPVLEECRRHSLATREPYGVWGGLSESERSALVKGSS